jgi:hypothetical protein
MSLERPSSPRSQNNPDVRILLTLAPITLYLLYFTNLATCLYIHIHPPRKQKFVEWMVTGIQLLRASSCDFLVSFPNIWTLPHFPAIFFCGARAELGPRPPRCWSSRSHTVTHAQAVGLLLTSDQLVAQDTAYTTHTKHTRRIYTPSAGFEPAIPTIKGLETYALDRTATWIGQRFITHLFIAILPFILLTRTC